MKQYFKAGKYYLEIDHKKQIFRWSQNSAWRHYINIKMKDGKTMKAHLEFDGYKEVNEVI